MTIWMHERGRSADHALHDITAWHNRTVTALTATAESLTADSRTPAQRRYVKLVCNVARGCYQTLCELEDRYRVVDE